MTGLIIFFMIEKMPKITFIISLVSFFAKNLSYQYSKAVKTILKYFKKLKYQDIMYKGRRELKIEKYSNSNWADNKDS